MDENAFVVFHSVLDEVINFVCCFVGTIEKNLVLLVKPSVSEVLHSNIGPLILNLSSATIYYSGYLVCNYEL